MMPRELKIKMLLESEKELFDSFTEKEQEDALTRIEFETMTHTEIGSLMTMSTLRLIVKAMELGRDRLPEEAKNAADMVISTFYKTLNEIMKTITTEQPGACPGCGEIHDEESAKRLIN